MYARLMNDNYDVVHVGLWIMLVGSVGIKLNVHNLMKFSESDYELIRKFRFLVFPHKTLFLHAIQEILEFYKQHDICLRNYLQNSYVKCLSCLL